jgi:opacity protein-like surface antigen
MKLDMFYRKLAGRTFSVCLFALSTSVAYSGAMGPESVTPAGTIYISGFGGGGSVTGPHVGQYGTAFYTEPAGGPLAVDAFGISKNSSMWMAGGHIGYEWLNMSSNGFLTPAIELEGYSIGGAQFEVDDVNNNTERLDEHNFHALYPLSTGVFLVNAILNANTSLFGKFNPYIGAGIGSAVVSISDAQVTQLSPPEPGVNHFNSDPSDKAVALALQPKIGLSYNFNPHLGVFAEYRFLYLSDTKYLFGSTVYPAHVATAPWQVKIKPQYYNMGTVGIQFDV